jgi:hypothetical protein
MPPIASHRTLAFVTILALAVGACAGAGPSGSILPAEATSTAPTARPSLAREPAAASSDAWLVVGRVGEPGLEVVLASTLERLYELPSGVPAATWGELVATEQRGDETLVNAITVQPQLPARTRAVPGTWRLPTLGRETLPVGVSADGSTVVLVEENPPAELATTRFAVVVPGEPTRTVELPGVLSFDALSPDGSILYVVEHLPGPPDAHYQVRAVDLPAGTMRETIIVDKRNLDEQMGGWPVTQLRHPDGVAFTLYRGATHPFIHALHTVDAWAVCLDLPELGAGDASAADDWGLAASADGRAVYAVNATIGLASAIDPAELTFRQTTSFQPPAAAATITLAKFGHQETGPVGRRVVVSPDGSTLFAAAAGGIVRLETAGLTATGTLLPGAGVEALALSLDGSTIYALLRAGGRIVKVDAVSGDVQAEVGDGGFDRLEAIASW